jgi:hypothetical protein
MGRRPRTWPSLLEKGPKTQKIGLKEQAPALVQRISDSASSHIACGSYRSATQGARGDCAASQPRVLAARSCAQPPRERSGRQTPEALRRRPIRPRLLTNDSHRDERRGVRGDCADDDTPRLSQERGRGGSRRIKTALRSFSPCHSPPQPRA